MNEMLDLYFVKMLNELNGKVSDLFGSFIGIATTLAGIFALVYLGIESYKMMLGEKQIDLGLLLRPFLIGLVIMLWVPFISILDAPCDAITDAGKEMFENRIELIDDAQRTRAAVQDSITMQVVKNAFSAEEAGDLSRDEEVHRIGIKLNGIMDAISGLGVYLVGKIRQMFFNIFETIIMMFWQAVVFLIFFLRLMFKSILAIVGPLSFAFSLLPSWKDAWSHWVSKYITVNLYGFLAYIVLTLSTVMMQYAIEDDIDVLQSVNADEGQFALFTVFQSGYHNGFVPALIVSILGLLLVPKVAEWIIPSSGTSAAASSMKRNVAVAAGTAAKGAAML